MPTPEEQQFLKQMGFWKMVNKNLGLDPLYINDPPSILLMGKLDGMEQVKGLRAIARGLTGYAERLERELKPAESSSEPAAEIGG